MVASLEESLTARSLVMKHLGAWGVLVSSREVKSRTGQAKHRTL